METIIHDSPDVFISLRTTDSLKVSPQHPIIIPDTLLSNILGEITKTEEGGILQQLFFTAPHSILAFSLLQREMLAAHLSGAFSKATKEETIFFKLPTTGEVSSPIEGTVAAFPPSYLVLTLTFSSSASGDFSKFHNSPSRIQAKTVPAVSRDNDIFSTEKAEKFMAIPDASYGIVIDYQHLSTQAGLTPIMLSPRFDQDEPHMNLNEKNTTPLEIQKLKEQLKLLQERIDQQTQEIHRLKHNASP